MTKKTKLLCDGDILLWEVLSNCETEVHWGEGLWTLHVWEDEAKAEFDRRVKGLEARLDGTAILCFSDPKANFRKVIYPDYKANRAGKRKPLCFKALRDWAEDNYRCQVFPALEADDIMGILATRNAKDKPIICSIDKDLASIPGRLYNWRDDVLRSIDLDEADYVFHTQTLTGDSTDNYPGCPKIGPVTALKLLAEAKDPWAAIVKAYEKAGLSEVDALIQARVARILRCEDWDAEKKEVIPWAPVPSTVI